MKLVPREGYSLGPEVSFGVSALIQCSIWHNLSGNRNAAKRGSAYKEIDIPIIPYLLTSARPGRT